MYNVNTIKSELLSLNGWRQNPDPSGEQLLEMTTSETGLFYNDEHPMLTYDNLFSIATDSELYVYPTFQPAKTDYAIGDIVESTLLYYRIKVDAVAQPVTNTEFWKVWNPFTQWLRDRTESAIIQAVNDWYNKKSKFGTISNLLERDIVLIGSADFDDEDSKSPGRVVGQCFKSTRSRSLLTKVTEISLQFTDNQDITVKVFKKGTKTPVFTETLTYANSGGVQWFTVDWTLESNEVYFVGYDDDSVTGSSLNSIFSGYNGCYPKGKYYTMQSYSVESDFTEMWNESDVSYNGSTNYGLNYKLYVGCDYTDFIVDQKDKFKTVIAKRVAMNLLRELVFNSNASVNSKAANVDKKLLLYEIDGDSQGDKDNNGLLRYQYDSSLMAIQFDYKGIDRVCMPCRRRAPEIKGIM